MQPIRLIEPADGSVTHPLQEHHWPVAGRVEEKSAADVSAFRWDDLEIVAPDRSVPRPVRFSWEKIRGGWRAPVYDLILARSKDLQEGRTVVADLSKPTVDIWHLYIGATYYWKVVARRRQQNEPFAESPVWQCTTNSAPPRWIRVPGITNVRDLGGWPLPGNRAIRQGLVYRSSAMNASLQITPKGRTILEDELKIRTDLDLRGEAEGAGPVLDDTKVQWIHAPISPYDCICDLAFRDGYRRIFQTFAEPANYPILFHCVGGADRGGTVAFLLNALLGKDRDRLMHDYELTTLSVWGERSRFSEQFQSLVTALHPFADHPDDITAQVEAYLGSIGVTDGEMAAIREQLVCEHPGEPG